MRLRTIPLGSVLQSIQSGVSPVCHERPPGDDGVGVLTLAAITNGRFDPQAAKAIDADEVDPSWTRVRAGTILVTRASGSKALVGACVLAPEDRQDRILPDTAWQLVLSDCSGVPAAWIAEILRSPYGRREIERIARGSSGISKITKDSFAKIPLPVDTPARMAAAAAALARHLCTVDAFDSLLAAKRNLKRGLMQELLTGRRRFPEFHSSEVRVNTRAGRLPGDWEVAKLGEHASERSERNGATLGPDRVMGVLKGVGLEPMRDHVRGDNLSRYKVVPPNAFAYNPMRINIGSIARSHFAEDCLVSPDYVVFVTDCSALLPEFLDHLRHSFRWRHFVAAAGAGSVRVRIYFRDLAEMWIPVPPIEEQKRIASILDALDREIALLNAQRDQFELQRRGLMQKLLSGEVEIPAGTPEA